MGTRTIIDCPVRASNERAFAIGTVTRGFFHIRRVVWGLALASEECRDDEEIRRAIVLIASEKKRRRRI